MQKFSVKIFYSVVAFALCGILFPLCSGAHNIGDVIGNYLSTDIVSYVEGVRVPSYNINGRTAIVAQNLNALGFPYNFGVSFDEETRSLTITSEDVYNTGGDLPLFITEEITPSSVGQVAGDVYYTDIVTFYESAPIESFNIGGLTCIYTDDLAKHCGIYLWDEESRSVNVYRSSTYKTLPQKISAGRVLTAEESAVKLSDTTRRWAEPSLSHLVENEDGTFTAVEAGKHINIETYDESFVRTSSFAIKKELDLFGAFFSGEQYNYIAFGQENLLDDSSREVIKIAIYDKNFVKISEVSINNCKTSIPFDASGAQMYENDRYLVLHTSRSQYIDQSGNRPQTQLTVIIDKHTWKPCNMLGKFQYNHTSHALSQFLLIDEGRLITANLSDAAPLRGVFLQELDFDGKVVKTQGIFNASGPLAANCTGIMPGGLASSSCGYLVPINSIDQTVPSGFNSLEIEGIENENRDVYLLWTDKNTWEMRHTCLARYSGTNMTGSVPYITNLPEGKFMILWQEFSVSEEDSSTVCYAVVDSFGNQIGSTKKIRAQLSRSCRPIFSDGKVIWYVNTPSGRDFYIINAQMQTSSAESVGGTEAGTQSPAKGTPQASEEQEDREKKENFTEVDGI